MRKSVHSTSSAEKRKSLKCCQNGLSNAPPFKQNNTTMWMKFMAIGYDLVRFLMVEGGVNGCGGRWYISDWQHAPMLDTSLHCELQVLQSFFSLSFLCLSFCLIHKLRQVKQAKANSKTHSYATRIICNYIDQSPPFKSDKYDTFLRQLTWWPVFWRCKYFSIKCVNKIIEWFCPFNRYSMFINWCKAKHSNSI